MLGQPLSKTIVKCAHKFPVSNSDFHILVTSFRVRYSLIPQARQRNLGEIQTAKPITVDFKSLPGEISTAAQFLKEHVRGQVKTRGNQIQLDAGKHKEVKLLLHKYLHHKGIEGYRVLSQSGIFEIAPLHMVAPARHEAGAPPPAASTLPYLFPNAPVLAPREKKPRAKRKQQANRKKS